MYTIIKRVIVLKKITILFLSLLLIAALGMGTFTVSAKQYTKDDLVSLVSTSNIYKHIAGDIKNLMRTTDVTDEQLNELYVVAQKFVDLKLEDKGNQAHDYTSAEIAAVLGFIDEACDILNMHYTFTPSKDPKHVNDNVFTVYDANNKIVYSYDGDVVKKTGDNNPVLYVCMVALSCILLTGAAVLSNKVRKSCI